MSRRSTVLKSGNLNTGWETSVQTVCTSPFPTCQKVQLRSQTGNNSEIRHGTGFHTHDIVREWKDAVMLGWGCRCPRQAPISSGRVGGPPTGSPLSCPHPGAVLMASVLRVAVMAWAHLRAAWARNVYVCSAWARRPASASVTRVYRACPSCAVTALALFWVSLWLGDVACCCRLTWSSTRQCAGVRGRHEAASSVGCAVRSPCPVQVLTRRLHRVGASSAASLLLSL